MSDTEDAAAPSSNRKARSSLTKEPSKEEYNDIPTEVSPGEAYVIFIEMNTLSNKLKLLNYENEYLLKWKMKPISK